jgi:putative transposase
MKCSNIVQAIPDVPGCNGPYNVRSQSPCKKGKDIVRKLRRADELAAESKTGQEIAAELGVSAATLYNWRRAYGGMDTDAAKELKELREQNGRLKRLLADAELEKDALREVAKGKF